ncbi:polysaccharide biosynthesis protein [Emticicia oligotrophica DSM 17448]|uniref:Polysaccharide biosynthesis protein n=2 Tax=Emticicia TaxID=312278 RepID=A0ABN4AQ14_EMTOG|nr:polysaccharide biosynthesis protein [Emticicia oligotrophica DSM 17448]
MWFKSEFSKRIFSPKETTLKVVILFMNVIKKQAFLGTIFSYGGVLVGFISQFFLIPHNISEAENGLLAVLLSYMYVLVQLSSLGFNAAGSRFFPHFRDAQKGHKGYLFLGLMTGLIGFAITSIGLFLLKDTIVKNEEHSPLFADNFYLLLPITLATLLFNLLDNYAKNLYDTVTGTFLAQFLQRFLILLALILVVFKWVNFEQFLYLWVLAVGFYVVPMFWKASRLDGFSLKPDFSVMTPAFNREFWFYAFLTILTGFSSMVILYIDKIMLAGISTFKETGIYNTASFFGSVMGMALMAVTKAAQPLIADSFAKNDLQNIHTIYKKSCTTSLIVGCWIFLGIYSNIDNLFQLLPPSYAAGKMVVIIISLGKLFDLATGLNGTILALSKHYVYDTYIMIGLIFITVALNYFLIPIYGMNGAAFALAIATVYYNLARYMVVLLKLKMQPFTSDLGKVLLVALTSWLIIRLLPNLEGNKLMSIMDMGYRSVSLTLLYGVVIYWSKVSPELNGAMKNLWLKMVKIF